MSMTQSAPLSLLATAPDCSAASAAVKSTQRQLTVMLVVICCAAVCLQLPYTVLYLLNADKDSLWPDHYHHLHANIFLAMKVTRALYNGTVSVRLYRQAVGAHCGR